MSVGSIEATEQNCATPEDVMSRENLYLDTLSTVTAYAQLGGMLILCDAEKATMNR